jgi:hypothetical protein
LLALSSIAPSKSSFGGRSAANAPGAIAITTAVATTAIAPLTIRRSLR